eukprot:4037329-Lingulodinium_polyedra.AAC.1
MPSKNTKHPPAKRPIAKPWNAVIPLGLRAAVTNAVAGGRPAGGAPTYNARTRGHAYFALRPRAYRNRPLP